MKTEWKLNFTNKIETKNRQFVVNKIVHCIFWKGTKSTQKLGMLAVVS